jgi:hypothetical protein
VSPLNFPPSSAAEGGTKRLLRSPGIKATIAPQNPLAKILAGYNAQEAFVFELLSSVGPDDWFGYMGQMTLLRKPILL